MAFTNEQLERYSRHIILKEVGVKGQKKQMCIRDRACVGIIEICMAVRKI